VERSDTHRRDRNCRHWLSADDLADRFDAFGAKR
jgi:hypothetical protein